MLSLQDSQSLADGYTNLKTILCHSISEDNSVEKKTIDKVLESISDSLPDTIKEHPSLAVLAFMRSAYGWKKDETEKRDPVSYTPYPSSNKKSAIIDYFKEYEQKRIKGEAQHFKFRMEALEEEDKASSSASCPTATVPSTQVGQPSKSKDASNVPSPPKAKTPQPTPKPGP